MERENGREWRVNRSKLENLITGMQNERRIGSLVRPASDKKPEIMRLPRGYRFGIPVNNIFVDRSFLRDDMDIRSDFPYVTGIVAPNDSRSSWYIVDADVYVPGEEFREDLIENNDMNRLLYSIDRLYGVIEILGRDVGAKGVTTKPMHDESDFKVQSLLDLGYRKDHTGGYFKRL